MKNLILVRHADALQTSAGGEDHDRVLSAAGRRQARSLRRWLEAAPAPEIILCSSAERAVQTLRGFQAEGASTTRASVQIDDSLYLASAERIRERLDWIDDSVETALVVAHNPGIGLFAHELAARGDEDHRERLARGFPPAGVAVLRCDGSRWLGLRPGTLVSVEPG